MADSPNSPSEPQRVVDGHDTDRSLNEILQELRVAQTGVQVFIAFLLTIPFAPAFADLDQNQRNLYAADLACAVISVALLVSPVAIHRAVFGKRMRPELVRIANVMTFVGLMMLLLAMIGGVVLVGTVVFRPGQGGRIWLPVVAGAALLVCWIVLPLALRLRGASDGR